MLTKLQKYRKNKRFDEIVYKEKLQVLSQKGVTAKERLLREDSSVVEILSFLFLNSSY